MKALRSLSSATRPDSPTGSKSRRSSSRTPEPAPKPTSAFAFTQINVASFDRAEAFFEKIFGWRFIGEPTSPAFIAPLVAPIRSSSALSSLLDDEAAPARMAPPIAPPPDHRVNYFTPRREVGQGHIAGGLFKFGVESTAVNFGERKRDARGKEVREGEGVKVPAVVNYVAVEDVAATMNAVLMAGGKAVGQPWMERDEMARFALFEDTEGNVFGLVQYLM
ncbi:hypothetical protein CONLIGDRAFT_646554 [Coniochaeta ligniaria NRRL 30616]|uniref:Glyoxalase/fosfomycin resistance/dioxygenase domain-containing protein n=1 Tax=Coniochaeta ligniaria NRRL 30616 TaxID=1408157 RepID=A0A1J7IZ67_9PEZI|nr:hypothetical protein CONLIGDRAFT_646554 [Coniochaeta ligniaria NRRL 30616]